MKPLSLSLAICSFVAAGTVIAAAQQEQETIQPKTSGATGQLSAYGNVVGPTSKPAAGVPVEITGPTGKVVYALTDHNGQWHAYNLPAGEYTVKPVKTSHTFIQDQDKASHTFIVENFGVFGAQKVKQASEIKLDKDYLNALQ